MDVEYYGEWVLLDAYFYKFWMLHKEFIKFIFQSNLSN